MIRPRKVTNNGKMVTTKTLVNWKAFAENLIIPHRKKAIRGAINVLVTWSLLQNIIPNPQRSVARARLIIVGNIILGPVTQASSLIFRKTRTINIRIRARRAPDLITLFFKKVKQ